MAVVDLKYVMLCMVHVIFLCQIKNLYCGILKCSFFSEIVYFLLAETSIRANMAGPSKRKPSEPDPQKGGESQRQMTLYIMMYIKNYHGTEIERL